MIFVLTKSMPTRLSWTWFQTERANTIDFPVIDVCVLLQISIICLWKFIDCPTASLIWDLLWMNVLVLFDEYSLPMNWWRTSWWWLFVDRYILSLCKNEGKAQSLKITLLLRDCDLCDDRRMSIVTNFNYLPMGVYWLSNGQFDLGVIVDERSCSVERIFLANELVKNFLMMVICWSLHPKFV